MIVLSGVLLAFLVATALAWWLAHPRCGLAILDHPNERSLHEKPIPRTGGLAFLPGVLVSLIVVASFTDGDVSWWWLLTGALLVGGVSFIDDVIELSPAVRFLVHAVAASLVVPAGLLVETLVLPGLVIPLASFLAILLSILFVIWLVNLFNFMDGMDGFSGGMALIGFGTFAILGYLGGNAGFSIICAAISASVAGFLLFNFPPARIFMGDVGASTVGYLAAVLSLVASQQDIFPLWVGVLVFSPFIVDATFTLLKRLLTGKKIWEAHRSHCYQRLVRGGWSHRRTVLWEYVLMLCVAVSALLAGQYTDRGQQLLLAGWIIIYVLLLLAVSLAGKRAKG